MSSESTGAVYTSATQTLSSDAVTRNPSDGELLKLFSDRRNRSAEASFATLMERHGPMVLRVCQQMLGDSDDALDAFQATFLVLVQKADSVRKRDSVASWLHGVARRVALRAKADAARRREHERRRAVMAPESVRDTVEDRPEIHDEIARLPEKYREPVVLCYLEGLSVEVAARRLKCPEGTVLSRLARARDRLRLGLTRRGLALPAVFIAGGLVPRSAAALPPALLETTAQAAMRFASGQGVASAAAVALAKSTLRAMLITKLTLAASVMTVGVAVGTAWGLHRHGKAPAAPVKQLDEDSDDSTEQRVSVHRPGNTPPTPQAAPSVKHVDEAWDDSTEQRVINLKNLGLALHNYHDANGRFPPQGIVGRNGQPLLSWRVAVLPFLGHRELYARFRLDEPWDSPHNKALIPTMPRCYAGIGLGKSAAGSTYYQVIAGPGTVFEGAQQVASSDISDGMSDTVAVVEAEEPVLWTKPEDLPFASDKPLPRLGGLSADGFLALFCNGEVRFVKKGISEAKLRSVITRSGREPVSAAEVGDVSR
jgi:RNA polymerase sigma factor (sigma-70 family)